MIEPQFDGEHIARIIEKLGFIAVRSSSRGGASALLGLKSHWSRALSVAFTIDGPHDSNRSLPARRAIAQRVADGGAYVALSDACVEHPMR